MVSTKFSFFCTAALIGALLVAGCSDDEPTPSGPGNEDEEVISQVTLTFTSTTDDSSIEAVWLDEDGDGVGMPTIDPIILSEGVSYNLSLEFLNTLGNIDEDITQEISGEAEEHMIFFGFTDGIFSDPSGDGNIDNRSDVVNYVDQDDNGLPLGLTTSWTSGMPTDSPGQFDIILKHQPDLKTTTSDATIGGTDLDISFPLIIEAENEEEVINQIVLTFRPSAGGDPIQAMWFDVDGDGVANPAIDPIDLTANTEYTLELRLANTLGIVSEDITEEIQEEGDEHMFFFGFTADIFTDPSGDGNIDNRGDDLNYDDADNGGLPIGLITRWTTGGATAASEEFRIILKHQPNALKTMTSDVSIGGTDVDITLPLNIR